MTPDIAVALIGILPQLIVIGVAGAIGFQYREPIADALQNRLIGLSLFGLSITLQPRDVNHAVVERSGAQGFAPSATSLDAEPPEGDEITARARGLAKQLVGRTILWVDDHPEWLVTERRLVRGLGIFVEPAATNDQAMRTLADPSNSIDVVISDIARDDKSSGLDLAPLIQASTRQPLIYYVKQLDPGIPPGAIGITNRPDRLLDLVMDAVERLPPRR